MICGKFYVTRVFRCRREIAHEGDHAARPIAPNQANAEWPEYSCAPMTKWERIVYAAKVILAGKIPKD